MTPIGSTSSNIRRATEFIIDSSCCSQAGSAGSHDQLDECAPGTSSDGPHLGSLGHAGSWDGGTGVWPRILGAEKRLTPSWRSVRAWAQSPRPADQSEACAYSLNLWGLGRRRGRSRFCSPTSWVRRV